MEPREENYILNTAEVVGGKPLRALANYFLHGTLPENETLQSVFDTLATDEETRTEAAALTQASSNRRLLEWAVSRHGCGARRLRELRQRNFDAFKTQVVEAMKGRSLAQAAKILGVSRRQMFRYAADIREHIDPHKRFHELWATASEQPSYDARRRALWSEMEGRLLRARTAAETSGILAEATRLSRVATEGSLEGVSR